MKRSLQSYRLWDPPVAHRLDEITGQLTDITSAHTFLQRLNALALEPNRDVEQFEAFTIAALVRYSRCFTSGSRRRLHVEDLKTATTEEIDVHDYIRGARDWHIAHPVNLQEVHAVHLIVAATADGTPIVIGGSSLTSSALALNSEQIVFAISLTKKWMELLQNRLGAEQLRLLPYAQALSPEQLLALPEGDPQPNRNVRARRKQPPAQ